MAVGGRADRTVCAKGQRQACPCVRRTERRSSYLFLRGNVVSMLPTRVLGLLNQ